MPIYPNDLDIPPFQFRRAIATTVSNYVPAQGEPVWSTDGQTLYVGDGSTVGGIPVGGVGFTATNATVNKLVNGSYEVALNANGTVSFPFGGTLDVGNTADFFIKNTDHPINVESRDTGTKVGSLVAEVESATMYARDTSDGSNVEISTDNNDHANPVVRIKVQAAGSSTSTWTFNDDGSTSFPSYTFPYADGTSGQVLETNGAGVLTWATVSSGGGSSTFTNITVTQTATIESIAFTGNAIAIGENATAVDTPTFQGGTAIGTNADASGIGSVAIGPYASATGGTSIRLGGSGSSSQTGSMSLGAGANATNYYATAVGWGANASGLISSVFGSTSQASGDYALAVGNYARASAAESIVLNATSGTSTTSTQSGFYVNPIRNTTSTQILYYDATTKEITYGTGSGVSGNPFDQTLNTTSNAVFKSAKSTQALSAGGYPLDSNGQANILTGNTQSAALVVSNYTSGLIPGIQIRGWGQNRPGGTATTNPTPAFTMEGARGTPASPTAVQNLDTIFAVSGGGYDGFEWSNGRQLTTFQLVSQATENFAGNATTTTNAGTRFFIRTQPQGVQLDATSRQMHMFQTWTAGSTTAPPQANLLFGAGIDGTTPTLINSNGLNSHTGYGNTNVTLINTKNFIVGVPSEEAFTFTGSISGTTLDVTALTNSSSLISVGSRIYSGTNNYGTVSAYVTGSGGVGTYTLSTSSTVASTTLSHGPDNTTLASSNFLAFSGGRRSGVGGRRNGIKSGDTLGQFLFYGQTGNNGSTAGTLTGAIVTRATETYSGSAQGSKITFYTANSGTTYASGNTQRLELKNRENTYYSDIHNFRTANAGTSLAYFSTATANINADTVTISNAGGATRLALFTPSTIFLDNNRIDIGVSGQASRLINPYNQGLAIWSGDDAASVVNAHPDGSTYISSFGTQIAQFTTSSVGLWTGGSQVASFASNQINLYNNQIAAGDGVSAPRIQGRVGLQLTAANANEGAELGLGLSGEFTFNSNGNQVAAFNTATSQIKSDEFTVVMQDNTQLLTAANYGVRINQGTLYVGDTGEDGTIRTSASGDDLTIQSNDGSTGGKILLQETNGVVLYANGTEVTNISTSSAVFSVPVTFPVYTAATKPASGQVGQQICISDSGGGGNPNGMMAFWDTTNSRWSYIHDNTAV